MWVEFNNNPDGARVGDCVIRALSFVTGQDWESIYLELMTIGLGMHDMPNANHVWGAYLRRNGFTKRIIPDICPDCYTVRNFCDDHPSGTYVLATGSHVVAVRDGNYYDTWDSGNEVPAYVWQKED